MTSGKEKDSFQKIAVIIAVSILVGSVLADQYHFLRVFYKSSIIHTFIGCLLFILIGGLTKDIRTLKTWQYISQISFLLIAFKGVSWLLVLHEYTHLSYLLSYFIIAATGIFINVIQAKSEGIKGSLYLFFLGIVIGFICQANFHIQLIYTITLLLAFTLSHNFFYRSKGSKFGSILASIIFLVLIFDHIKSPTNTIISNQDQYNDRIIYSTITDEHQVDITSWKGNNWYYYDNKVQFSSLDEWLFSEPMVHSLIAIIEDKKKVLIIGGEHGILIKELLKYEDIESIDVLVSDKKLVRLASENLLFNNLNNNSLKNERVHLISEHEISLNAKYQAVLIDLPDPINQKWNAYYTMEFYQSCDTLLDYNGALITQAGSPYFATKAFASIDRTIQAAGFNTLPLHNQVLSLGEWGWVLASKSKKTETMRSNLLQFDYSAVETKWMNSDAAKMLVSFGKPLLTMDSVAINTIKNPILIDYYRTGNYTFR